MEVTQNADYEDRAKMVSEALVADPEWQAQVAETQEKPKRSIETGDFDTVNADGLRELLGLTPNHYVRRRSSGTWYCLLCGAIVNSALAHEQASHNGS